MERNLLLEERASQAEKCTGTQKSAEGHPSPTAMDEMNFPKQLAELFVDRHENEFRFVPRSGRWLYFNGERWCLDGFGHHLDAARRPCREAAERMWDPNVNSESMVSALLRLASFNPKMTAAIGGETEPYLAGPLGRREVRYG